MSGIDGRVEVIPSHPRSSLSLPQVNPVGTGEVKRLGAGKVGVVAALQVVNRHAQAEVRNRLWLRQGAW